MTQQNIVCRLFGNKDEMANPIRRECSIITPMSVFPNQRKLMVFQWSLSDSKSPRVSRTLLGILANLKNTVVWMVSSHPPISKTFMFLTNHLVTVPSAPIIIGITVTFMFHSFLVLKWGLDTYLSIRFPSILLCSQPGR